MKNLWILIGSFWYKQYQRNDAKGYITFDCPKV